MPIVSVPKIIREKLGEEGADALVELINQVSGEAATKTDLIELESRLEKRINELESTLRKEISEVESSLRKEINSTMIWNIVLWITVLLGIIGTALYVR